MTEQEHLEVSRKLALAIGWKPEQMTVYDDGELWIQPLEKYSLSQHFDYRDWNVIGPIVEKFDCFPYKWTDESWTVRSIGAMPDIYANTPQLAIALAVIAAQGVK